MSTRMSKLQRQHCSHMADALTELVADTFNKAYKLRLSGMSEDAILLDYDIQAAGAEQLSEVAACGRSAIKAATRAVQHSIPFGVAYTYLMLRVNAFMEQLLHDMFAGNVDTQQAATAAKHKPC